jgi:Flp pilus assembly protein TadG
MRLRAKLCTLMKKAPGFSRYERFRTATEGATAVEFAMVAVPFFLFVFMLTGFALYFFTMNSLDKGVDTVSREIRTGQAQKADMTVKQFKDKVCLYSGNWVDCNKASVFVDKPASWSALQQRNCFKPDGTVVTNTASGTDKIAQYSGTAGDVVLVTICYQWDFARKIPFISALPGIENMTKLQTTIAFRTEPYN